MQASLLAMFMKFTEKFPFISKISFITSLEHCLDYYNNLGICLNWFEAFFCKLYETNRNQKKEKENEKD
jgi:hypothetical protein